MSTKRPLNILWIQTDEHRTDSLGCYGSPFAGHPQLCTPNLDALADRGILFLDHHTQSPVCVASRTCELTGRYPHETGILNNSVHYTWGRWPEGMVSFPELFAAAGYATVNMGKYHTPHHATWQENWHFEWFRDEASFIGLADGFDEAEHEIIHAGHNPKSVILSGRYPNVHGGRTPQTYLTDHALDWLRMYAHVRRPFLMRVSFLAPHTPVLAPEPFYSMHDPADMHWDAPDEALLTSRPRYEIHTSRPVPVHAYTDAQLRRMRSTYYGLVAHIDQQVGRLLDCLDDQGELDNTIVLFSADHGDLMGEYGQFQKGQFYDIVTRVPMIIAGPGVPRGKRRAQLTEIVDLAPTLLNLAGLDVPPSLSGRDMLRGTPREDVIGEIVLPRASHRLNRRSWIRTERWSLDFSSEIDGEPTTTSAQRDGKLVDLRVDPLEHVNLYDDPAYADVVSMLQARFFERTAQNRRPVQIGGPPL